MEPSLESTCRGAGLSFKLGEQQEEKQRIKTLGWGCHRRPRLGPFASEHQEEQEDEEDLEEQEEKEI